MTTTRIIVLAAGLALFGASGASAQTEDPKVYGDLNIAGQTQSVTIATSSTFPLYGESGGTSSSVTVGRGLVFDAGAGYFVRKHLAVGIAVSLFTRSPTGTAFVTLPDPIAYNSFTTLAAAPKLAQTELGTHLKLVYVYPINDKLNVAISAGPSIVRVDKEIATASVVNGAAQITVASQTGTAIGGNGGLDLNYFFSPRIGGGLFVRYILGEVNLPAASSVKVGGFQGGLGLRVRF
jgi:ABC-type glycerol-3-phosphate transport system substrate-binding protein